MRDTTLKQEYWEIARPSSAAELTRQILRYEELGLTGVWAIQLHSPPFPTLAAAAMASRRLKIGSGIALAFTRSPVETALMTLDLDRLNGGRMVLGLATSVRTVNENQTARSRSSGKPSVNKNAVYRRSAVCH